MCHVLVSVLLLLSLSSCLCLGAFGRKCFGMAYSVEETGIMDDLARTEWRKTFGLGQVLLV